MEASSQPKILSSFALAMISVAAVVNLRNLPIMASAGSHAIVFYCLAASLFLIPSALVCAELASTHPEDGGIYLWVKKAFGYQLGFFTIWSEWFNNVIGFPATLSFIAATIAFVFFPHIQQHKYALFALMITIIWSCTFFNFFGVKVSSRLNIVGAIFGSLIPGIIIIALGSDWFFTGHHIQINLSLNHLMPAMHGSTLALFLGVLLGYAGMQITAFHVTNVKNPGRDFPRAIFVAVIAILALTIFSSLAIAMIVPHKQLSLVSGVMQGFYAFFRAFHISWALPILAFLIAISGISSLSAWLLAPARGLAVAIKQGNFPRWLSYENRQGIPVNILLIQAVIATGLSLIFIFAPNISTGFWMLLVLTAQFTLAMYILIFASAIRLRYKYRDIKRPFKIPGGNIGIWLVAGTSLLVCCGGIILGYFPPASLNIHHIKYYEMFLISGNIVYLVIPYIIYKATKARAA